jgi:hypothetical protein
MQEAECFVLALHYQDSQIAPFEVVHLCNSDLVLRLVVVGVDSSPVWEVGCYQKIDLYYNLFVVVPLLNLVVLVLERLVKAASSPRVCGSQILQVGVASEDLSTVIVAAGPGELRLFGLGNPAVEDYRY